MNFWSKHLLDYCQAPWSSRVQVPVSKPDEKFLNVLDAKPHSNRFSLATPRGAKKTHRKISFRWTRAETQRTRPPRADAHSEELEMENNRFWMKFDHCVCLLLASTENKSSAIWGQFITGDLSKTDKKPSPVQKLFDFKRVRKKWGGGGARLGIEGVYFF